MRASTTSNLSFRRLHLSTSWSVVGSRFNLSGWITVWATHKGAGSVLKKVLGFSRTGIQARFYVPGWRRRLGMSSCITWGSIGKPYGNGMSREARISSLRNASRNSSVSDAQGPLLIGTGIERDGVIGTPGERG